MPPQKIFIITDAGRDHDDELAFAILAGLQKKGLCEIVGVITNLHPVWGRAQLVKGTLRSMGIEAPVAQGYDAEPEYRPSSYELGVSYLAKPEDVESGGQNMMRRVFLEAKNQGKKITLLLISGMMDADQFLKENSDLALSTLDKVVIMGDVAVDKAGEPLLDKEGFLQPGNAYNNTVDRYLNDDPDFDIVGPSAKSLYKNLQQSQIPTVVLTRHTAYEAFVGPDYYESLAATGHPLGMRLHKDQNAAIGNLWTNIQQGTAPSRMTPGWFAKIYCSSADAFEKLKSDPSQYARYADKFNLYDPLAALAAVIPVGLFIEEKFNNSSMTIIGASSARLSLKNATAVHHLLNTLPQIGFSMKNNLEFPNSIQQLEKDFFSAPDTDITRLAKSLIEGAKGFDLTKTKNLGVNFRFSHIVRNMDNPPNFTDKGILGASWADNSQNPLESGEQWNEGRRATLTGLRYTFNEAGEPLNPYMNTGLNGRGVLGQFAVNHAVDNGALFIREEENGKPGLYALGILRKFDNDAPAFSGGFTKFKKDAEGRYLFDQETTIESQMEEFFEEMISGSIELLPEYHERVEEIFKAEIVKRETAQNNTPLSSDHTEEIREQVETGLKLEQVRDKDPEFLNRLYEVIAAGKECFAGPVLNDNRNTNNAWIESRLSWFLMDQDVWNYIKGSNPVFDYEFSAGDDASGVVYHRIDHDLIEKAYASHGSMFSFMAASFLLDRQEKGIAIDKNIIAQLQSIIDVFPKPEVKGITYG